MCKKALVFAGTLEGRTIAEYLAGHGVRTYVCVATSYGESLLSKMENLIISSHRLTLEEMERYLAKIKPEIVVDATHPYAAQVTENIIKVCERVDYPYIRLLRNGGNTKGMEETKEAVYVDSVEQAVKYLETTKGNILLTTGSKALKGFTKLTNFKDRLYARVLSLPGVVEECAGLGFEGKHLICMQGPFSYELNQAMIRQFDARYLVTKESGSPGGFVEKCQAALNCGAKLIIIGRPGQEEGFDFETCKKYLQNLFQIKSKPQVSLVGIGMGSEAAMTKEALNTFQEAELIIGAKRMVEAVAKENQAVHYEYEPVKIKEYLKEHTEYERVAIALSGDIGFYSGAKRLMKDLEPVNIVCGISSVVYFCSKIKTSWEDVKMASLHGQEDNVIGYVQNFRKVFVIIGSKDGVKNLSHKLIDYQLKEVILHIGERLSYPEEKILAGLPEEFQSYETDALSVVLIENKQAKDRVVTPGIPDEEFLRDKVPMTKEEVRSVSLAKLRLKKDSVVFDIGAGSGSVSVEMAKCVIEGRVYAIERKAQAVELIQKNKMKFAVDNLEIVEGPAPDILEELSVPTHAFIGGSAGNLKEIISFLLEKNPGIRIVLNAITLETVAQAMECLRSLPVIDVDIVNLSVGKAREIQDYHLMVGQNPVYIISCTGGKKQ